MDPAKAAGRIKEIGGRCGLGDVAGKLVGELSKGFRQRVGLAQAMLHDPDILILDEPTSGLDPNQIVEIRSLIKEIGREKTVILSTHILPEVQATCSRIVIISGGKLVADGTPDAAARARARRPLPRGRRDRTASPRRPIRDRLAEPGGRRALRGVAGEDGSHCVRHRRARAPSDLRKPIFRAAVDNRWTLLELARESASLEDVFRHLTDRRGRSSHEPRTGHLAARDPHLLQLARRVHRRHRLHDHRRLPVLHPAVPGRSRPSMRGFFEIMPLLFMFLVPAITMRLLADEKSSGTLELLITMPVRDWEVVLGKFLAAMALLVHGAGADAGLRHHRARARPARPRPGDRRLPGPAADGRRLRVDRRDGLGVHAQLDRGVHRRRSRSRSRCSSSGSVTQFVPQSLQPLASFLSIDSHFENIGRGVIDTRDVIYYLSVMGVCLLLATLSLESRRWR